MIMLFNAKNMIQFLYQRLKQKHYFIIFDFFFMIQTVHYLQEAQKVVLICHNYRNILRYSVCVIIVWVFFFNNFIDGLI